jgi:hypothetical protein
VSGRAGADHHVMGLPIPGDQAVPARARIKEGRDDVDGRGPASERCVCSIRAWWSWGTCPMDSRSSPSSESIPSTWWRGAGSAGSAEGSED